MQAVIHYNKNHCVLVLVNLFSHLNGIEDRFVAAELKINKILLIHVLADLGVGTIRKDKAVLVCVDNHMAEEIHPRHVFVKCLSEHPICTARLHVAARMVV